jgi:microcystin-dependent protein
LLCYGQEISRTTYSALFTVVSTTYGVGDGSTTFNLPDLRGRVPAGLDNMGGSDAGRLSLANTLGTTGGSETVTLTSAQSGVPAHSHANTAAFTGTAASHTHTQDSHNHTQNSHGHSVSDPTHSHAIHGNLNYSGGGGLIGTSGSAFNLSWNTQAASTGVSVVANTATNIAATATNQNTSITPAGTVAVTNVNNTAANAASAHDNMQPTILLNYIIKT